MTMEPRRPAPKIGLSLSGGGFRASFFHLGALKRLAQLGLLHRVETLSTVSGGSLLAAHYYLLLKKELETGGTPDMEALVDRLEREFRSGVRKDLRNRLLLPPWEALSLLWPGRTLGGRMVRLLDRHLYRQALRRLGHWRGGAPLSALKIETDGLSAASRTLNSLNASRSWKIPKLVINATSLNTGRAFRFSIVELGDEKLGMIRQDEVDRLPAYRAMAEAAIHARSLEREWDEQSKRRPDFHEHVLGRRAEDPVRARRFRETVAGLFASGTPPVASPPEWLAADMAILRRAKLAAWYLLQQGGALELSPSEREGHGQNLGVALRECLPGRDSELSAVFESQDAGPLRDLCEVVVDLYLLRLSRIVAPKAAERMRRITLTEAAQASANFPPVFEPVPLYDLYESKRFRAMHLTDGGVHDNQGMNALLEEECTHVIASDAGQIMSEKRSVPGRLSMMLRLPEVLMSNVRDLQLSDLYDRKFALREAGALGGLPAERLRRHFLVRQAAFFQMESPPARGAAGSPVPHPRAREVARLRTDLDAFTDTEIDALIYQGYQLCDAYVRRYLDELAPDRGWSAPPPERIPPLRKVSRRALEPGASLFLRLWKRGGIGSRIQFALLALLPLAIAAGLASAGCGLLGVLLPLFALPALLYLEGRLILFADRR